MTSKNATEFYKRARAPFYGILRVFGAVILLNFAVSAPRAEAKPDPRFLRTPVVALPLLDGAKSAALALFPDQTEDRVTLEDVVQLRAHRWFKEDPRYHELWRNYLFSQGLRFGMTRAEIAGFTAGDARERVTSDSNIEILKLHSSSERLLIEMGIDQIGDGEFLEEAEINSNPKLNDVARAEIIHAFRRAGFPLKFNEWAEIKDNGAAAASELPVSAKAEERRRPRNEAYDQVEEDWRELRLSSGLRAVLQNVGIVKREELASYTKTELFNFPGISRDQVYRLEGQLRQVGITIYLDAIERAAKLRLPIEPTTPILGHVQIDRAPGENRKAAEALAKIGLFSVGELMNADRGRLPDLNSIHVLLRRIDEMTAANPCVTALDSKSNTKRE